LTPSGNYDDLSEKMSARAVSSSTSIAGGAGRAAEPLIDREAKPFRELFNRLPFQFQHGLAGHPLFELPRLAKLAEAILTRGNPRYFVHFNGTGTAASRLDRERRENVAEAVSQVERPGSWIKLSRAQDVDPDYAALLKQILGELEERTGVNLDDQITWASATIFLGAPRTLTPYHMDHESNFLFQVGGEKEVNLFDPADRTVLSEREIETFYIGELNALHYRDEIQQKAFVYHLKPGQAVHHPPLAPHWVRNGSQPTIALSVGFCMKSIDVTPRVHQINYYLRKLGMSPSSIGTVPWKDQAKIAGLGLLSKRHPTTERETYGSGIDRLRWPLDVAKGLVRKTLKRSTA
jgi:Cupin-like domain